jgi:hypothetical protein
MTMQLTYFFVFFLYCTGAVVVVGVLSGTGTYVPERLLKTNYWVLAWSLLMRVWMRARVSPIVRM